MRNRLASITACAGLAMAGLVGGIEMRTAAAQAPIAPSDTAALGAQYEQRRTEFKTWGRWAPLGQESKGTTSLITPQKVANAMMSEGGPDLIRIEVMSCSRRQLDLFWQRCGRY